MSILPMSRAIVATGRTTRIRSSTSSLSTYLDGEMARLSRAGELSREMAPRNMTSSGLLSDPGVGNTKRKQRSGDGHAGSHLEVLRVCQRWRLEELADAVHRRRGGGRAVGGSFRGHQRLEGSGGRHP